MKIRIIGLVLAFLLPAYLHAGYTVPGPSALSGPLRAHVEGMSITHSGSMMNSQAQLDFIKARIAANEEPWKTYYTRLAGSSRSALT